MIYFLQEKRGDREVEQLFRALELTTEIKQAQVLSNFLTITPLTRFLLSDPPVGPSVLSFTAKGPTDGSLEKRYSIYIDKKVMLY